MYEHLNSQASPHCIATFTLQEGQLLWVSFNLLRYELWRVKQVKKEPTYAYIKDLRHDVCYDEVILGNSGAGLLCQYRIICMVMVVWLLRYCPAGAILGGWGKCCLWGKNKWIMHFNQYYLWDRVRYNHIWAPMATFSRGDTHFCVPWKAQK